MSRMPGVYSQALPGLVSLERRVGGAIGSYFIDGVAGGALLVVSQMPRWSHDMWPTPSQRMLLGLTQAQSAELVVRAWWRGLETALSLSVTYCQYKWTSKCMGLGYSRSAKSIGGDDISRPRCSRTPRGRSALEVFHS